MKRLMLSFCLLCGLLPATQAQEGIIGINTVNPKGVLHIDGTGNNPSTGTVSPERAEDDVLIDAAGRIGIGLLSPAAKVDINTSAATPGGLRLQDGTQGDGKFLFSNASGLGSWASISLGDGWYAALYDGPVYDFTPTQGIREYENYTQSLISSAEGDVDGAAGSITVPLAGMYRISMTLYWDSDRTSGTTPYLTKTILRINGNAHRTYTFWGMRGGTGKGVLQTFVDFQELDSGDVVSLATDETPANGANRTQAYLFMVELPGYTLIDD
jgi:hypothetical protein